METASKSENQYQKRQLKNGEISKESSEFICNFLKHWETENFFYVELLGT